MAKDVIITPLDGDIQFQNTAGTNAGLIEQTGDDLAITNAVGDVLIGDGSSDLYIGDGVASVDLVFDVNGSVRGETGVTLTLGASGSTTAIAGLSSSSETSAVMRNTTTGALTYRALGSNAFNSTTIPTNNNQLTNGAGYITGYTETDTLASVTARGASTSTSTTFSGGLVASGGISGLTLTNGISGSNFNISGVNQVSISDPGEGIVFGGGTSGNITLAVVDDASDNILRVSGTGAELQVGTNRVLTTADEGSGNGLDADTLDGQHASAFLTSFDITTQTDPKYLRSNASDAASGTITFNAAGVATTFGSSADGSSYSPTEGGSTASRYWLRFDKTNNASYPYLTNRTPNGDVAIFTGTAAGGAENEHFRIKGGDGTVNAYFSNANVGIGTTSPSYALEVQGDSTTGVLAVQNASNGRDTFRSMNAAGVRTANFGNNSTGHGLAIVRNSSGVIKNYIAGDGDSYFTAGNVGIGTTSPSSELDVEGTITSNNLKLQNLTTNTSDTSVLTLDQGQNVRVRTLGSNAFNSTSYLPLAGGTMTGELDITRSADTFISFTRSGVREWRHNVGSDGHYRIRNQTGTYNVINISDDNNVGLGTDPNSANALHVKHPTSDAPLRIESGDTHTGITFEDPNGTNHLFYYGSENHFYFNGSGVTLGIGVSSVTTTNLSLDVENKVRASGIMFGTDTADANTLDDYEEGTFTPTIHAGASNIVAASNNYGKYTRIGNVVHCSGRFQSTSLTPGSSSTNVELGGLPFSASTPLSSGTGAIAGAIGLASGFSGEKPTAMQIRDNEPNAFLYYQNASLGFSNIKGNDFSSGANTIVFQITYHVA